MAERGITPSQTVGPFFAYCLTPEAYDARGIAGNEVATADAPGRRIHVEGRVLDGASPSTPAMRVSETSNTISPPASSRAATRSFTTSCWP
jgi:protocatechuate 3,4-dioxygenase beta subunit